jgi:hypothetical protein
MQSLWILSISIYLNSQNFVHWREVEQRIGMQANLIECGARSCEPDVLSRPPQGMIWPIFRVCCKEKKEMKTLIIWIFLRDDFLWPNFPHLFAMESENADPLNNNKSWFSGIFMGKCGKLSIFPTFSPRSRTDIRECLKYQIVLALKKAFSFDIFPTRKCLAQ